MSTPEVTETLTRTQSKGFSKLPEKYSTGPLHFAGTVIGLHEHDLFDKVIDKDPGKHYCELTSELPTGGLN